MAEKQAVLGGAAMICATLVGIFVALPVIRATSAYNAAAEKYDLERACLLAGQVADAWAVLGPVGRAESWRETEQSDCNRVKAIRARDSMMNYYGF